MSRHKRVGEWTDSNGLLCQATALHLRRHIYIVGTANTAAADRGYTRLEGGEGADLWPPLYIGYYQDQHYQSLARPATLPSLLSLASAPGFQTVACLAREMGLQHLAPTQVRHQVLAPPRLDLSRCLTALPGGRSGGRRPGRPR